MLFPKILQRIGLIACIVLVVACFMPWITFPAQNETFTGFYVKKFPSGVYYGRPGPAITILSCLIFVFMFLPKIWAKRTNIFLSGFLVAFVFAAYIRFTNSLFENEISRRYGIFIVMLCSLIILISCMFPDLKVKDKKKAIN